MHLFPVGGRGRRRLSELHGEGERVCGVGADIVAALVAGAPLARPSLSKA